MKKNKFKIAKNILIFTAIFSGALSSLIIVKKLRDKLETKTRNEKIKQNIKIKNVFKEAKTRLDKGDLEQISESLQKLPKDKLDRSQIFDIYAILAQIKMRTYQKTEDIAEKNKQFASAIFYLNEANDYVDQQSIQEKLLYYYGKLYFIAKNYQLSLDNFSSVTDTSLLTADEKNMLNLYKGDCYKNLNRDSEALKEYQKILQNKDNNFKIKAKINSAQVYSKASKNPKILQDIKKVSTDNANTLQAKYTKLALDFYNKILKNKKASMDDIAEARVGIFTIKLNNSPTLEIYTNVNSILNSTFRPKYKVNALFALAAHEEKNDNIQQSITILHGALSNYRKISSAKGAYVKLYHYYKKIGDWNGAFSMAKELLNDRHNFKTLVLLTNDFASDNNPLFVMLENAKKVDQYIKTLEEIIEVYKNQMPEEWEQIKHQTNFIIAQSSFKIKNYKLAQKYLDEFFVDNFPDKKTAEKVLFLDIHTAIALKKSYAVIITRCLRYFSHTNKGENYKEVMAILLDNYYKSGLYSEAINIAKKIYLDELKQLTSNNSKKIRSSDKNWLKTVAKIGQCYAKKNDFYNSNLIIKQYALDFLDKEYASDLYVDWAKISSHLQQYLEARRRYDIAWLKTEDKDKKLIIDIDRLLLDFRYRKFLENFYNDANALIEEINNSKNKFTIAEKKKHSRALYEAMMNLALEDRNTKYYNRILERIMNLYANDYWPGYWALRDIINDDGENDVNVILQNSQLYIKNIPQTTELQKRYLQMVKDQVSIITNLNETKNNMANLKQDLGL